MPGDELSELQMLKTMVTEMMQTMKMMMTKGTETDKAQKGRERTPLNRQRAVEHLPKFEGSYESYEDWRTKTLAFIGEDDGIKKLLQWAENQSEEVLLKAGIPDAVIDGAHPDPVRASCEVWALLIGITTKQAYTMVDNVKEQNGLHAWVKLARLYGKVHPRARRRLFELIMRPKTVAKGYEDLAHCIELWEKVKRRYETSRSGEPVLLDAVLVVGFQALLPEKASTICWGKARS